MVRLQALTITVAFDARSTEEVALVRVSGCITTEMVPRLCQAIDDALKFCPNVQIDLNDATELDHHALLVLLSSARRARHLGGHLRVVAPSTVASQQMAAFMLTDDLLP